MPGLTFSDLPRITSHADLRRVHHTAGVFFVKRGGKAHSAIDCIHLEDTDMVDNASWRIATDTECRQLGIPWCDDC